MMLKYSYRILPSRRQHRALERILESQRQLYNGALEERIDYFRKTAGGRSFFDQCKALTEWRRSDPEATSVPANLQRWTLKRVDDAYQSFFRRTSRGENPGFPRFRGRGRFATFGFREFSGITLDRGVIRFRGMPGNLRVHLHRPLPPDLSIKTCTFHKDVKGWTVGFVIEKPHASPRRSERVVGIDLGITTFAALSDGGSIPSLRAARTAERRLRVAQRALSRKARGSSGRRKARNLVVRHHAAVVRLRTNQLHQASARLIRDYDVIVLENLNLKGLVRSALAKHVHDASWARFISMLRYKAECAGARVVEVDPISTSQECSNCSREVPKRLNDRLHECPHCGLTMDRDLNAARNILNRAGMGPGLRNAADCGTRAGGNLYETGRVPISSRGRTET